MHHCSYPLYLEMAHYKSSSSSSTLNRFCIFHVLHFQSPQSPVFRRGKSGNSTPYQPSRSFRSSNQLLLTAPRDNLTIGQRAFSHSSPSIWNAMPLSVRDAPSVSTFKRRLKSFQLPCLLYLRHWASARASDSNCAWLCCAFHAISFQYFQPMYSPDPPTSQTDRRTDGETDGRYAIAIPHFAQKCIAR